jgi:SAM-dependent methyltransferase
MTKAARYDGIADWYDHEFRSPPSGDLRRETLRRILGEGPGRLLDVGCGTGVYTTMTSRYRWAATGIDVSEDMLRLARQRGLEVIHADATDLPFEDESFDAVMSMWTHTDVDDFPAVVKEVARVLSRDGRFVYIGAHPCFVGPHSRFVSAEGVPVLYPGYRRTGRYAEAPGVTPDGLRAKVGAIHLPLGLFLQTFVDAGFRLEHFEESDTREYPHMVAMRCRL